jgi:hypothetical protein
MLRRLIVPIFLIFVVAGVASMCTAVTGARAKRRLQQHQPGQRTSTVLPSSPKAVRDFTQRAGEPQLSACPEQLPDIAGWRRMTADAAPIDIPVPPDFEMVPQTGSVDVHPPFLVLRATNGDEFRLTRATVAIRAKDFRDYESTSTCRFNTGNILFADVETARDTWRGGEHRAVLANYFLGSGNYITLYGTTETAEHQRQLLAAIHGARFQAR